MKLRFKQRFFSWLDSYDVYDENGNVYFTVEGQLAFTHTFHIYDKNKKLVGKLKQAILSFFPTFYIYDQNDREIGYVQKELSLFTPKFSVNVNGWEVYGDFFGWDYAINKGSNVVARISKELFEWTDTYTITVSKENALSALLVVLAIDAVKCSNK